MVVATLMVVGLGAALALLFRIWILVPSTVIVVTSSVSLDWFGSRDIVDAIVAGALLASALQLGYVGGLFVNRLIATAGRNRALTEL